MNSARENYLRHQRAQIQRVLDSKKVRQEQQRKEDVKTEVILKDALEWADKHSYNDPEKANKEVQKVLDYYKE